MSTTRQQRRRREPRPDLRHDPARRRAVAGDLAEQAGKARDRPPARAAGRGRDRGRLPDHLARRLRVGAGDRARGRRPGDLRAGAHAASRTSRRPGTRCSDSERPRIHTFIATSDIHIERKLQTTREDVKGQVRAAVAQAREYTEDVEFSPEDGSRSDVEYMAEVIQIALDEGATTINVPDTVGYTMPSEYAAMFDRALPAGARAARRRRLGALPRRPGAGGRQLAGRPGSRLPPGRVRDQRHRRARRQRLARGDRDAAAHARAEPRPVDGRRDDRDRAHEPAGLAPDRLPGAAEQGDRRAQRVRARGRHPPGRRAEGAHHLRDHGRDDRRAAQQLDRARQALRPPRAAAKRWRRWASSSTARR